MSGRISGIEYEIDPPHLKHPVLSFLKAYWDGKRFISRLGNEFHAPDWFIAGLPGTPLDGELWVERKAFQKTVSIVRRQDKSDHWKEIRYVVFDAPAMSDPFEERMRFLADCLATVKSEYAIAHEQQRCRDFEHLRTELARIETLGGEGLMLRQPGSKYEAGRSTSLLKVKNFHDAEGVVIDHVAGNLDTQVSGAQLAQFVAQSRALVQSLTALSNKLDREPTQLIFGDRRKGYTPP